MPKTSSTSCDQAVFVDQATGAGLPSDAVPVAGGEQAGNEPDQVPGDVEHDTISGHAEPSGQGGYFGETSSTGGSASFPVMSAYVRASSRTPCYRPSVGFPATEKTSLHWPRSRHPV